MTHGLAISGAPAWAMVLLDICCGLIVIIYCWIGWQGWQARSLPPAAGPGDGDRARCAAAQFFGIFVMCAVSGYLPRLIPIDWRIVVAAHVVLTTVAVLFAHSGRAALIVRRLV